MSYAICHRWHMTYFAIMAIYVICPLWHMTYVGHNMGVKRTVRISAFMPIASNPSKWCCLIVKVDNAVLSQILCIFENFLCIKYAAWRDPKWAQNDLNIFVSVIITLENGIRHLLKIFEKLFYLGQFWVTLEEGDKVYLRWNIGTWGISVKLTNYVENL